MTSQPPDKPRTQDATKWLLEAVRQVPSMKFAVAVVGLVAAAAISCGVFLSNYLAAIIGGFTVLFFMFLLRIFAESKLSSTQVNVAKPMRFLIWTTVAAYPICLAMGIFRVGLLMFGSTPPAIGLPKQFTLRASEASQHALTPAPDTPPIDVPQPNLPFEFPDRDAISAMPPQKDVDQPPPVRGDKVVFRYRNDTGRNLRLLLYNVYYHYHHPGNVLEPKIAWRIWPFPPDKKDRLFDDFGPTNTGHYAVFLEDERGHFVELGTKMLFYSEKPLLIVSMVPTSEGETYHAEFTTY